MISVSIVTVSDRSFTGDREDRSGKEISLWAEEKGYRVMKMTIVPDEIESISEALRGMCEEGVDLVLTTGGTGCATRDVTPDATAMVVDRVTPGFGEVMRMRSLEVTSHAILSRATAGIKDRSLIINLPGSPKAVRECLGFIEKAIPHAVELIHDEVRDCGDPAG